MTCMPTYNGHRFDLSEDALASNCIDIDDIATSLAKQCRFNGHVPGFYSVAEHSVLVSQLVPESLALHGLMHDVAETYFGDIVAPVKAHCPWVTKMEARTHRHICSALAHDHLLYTTGREHRLIKEADLTALAIEFQHFFGWVPENLVGFPTEHAKARPQGFDWQDARLAFIGRYHQLTMRAAS
nr:hypothetical protein 3 [Saccharospirillaceae bacterium]